MKNPILLLFLLIGYLAGHTQYAAHPVIKWAPAGLVFGKLSLGTEYNFKKKNSIELYIGIPMAATRTIDYDNKQSDIESKVFSVLAGYRRYLGKKPAAGFYAEPYFKYLEHHAQGILEGDLDSKVARMDTKTDYKAWGAGVQLGYQFLIAKRICLDFFLIGPEANIARFNSQSTDIANSIPWTLIQSAEAERQIKDAINDIPILKEKLKISVDPSKKTVYTGYKGFLPGLRLGASIGFRL